MKQFILALVFLGTFHVHGFKLCDQKAPGSFVGNPSNCNEFYMCRPGRPVAFSCPLNMYFDVNSKACGYQAFCSENGAIVGGGEDASQHLGPEYTPIEAKPSRLVPSSTVCRGAATGTVRLDTTGCSAFFQCTNAGPLRLECPAGTLFDSNRMFCEVSDLASCAFVAPPSNNGQSSGSGAGNLLDVMCFGKKVGTKYAHPTNCTQYFLCNGRNAVQLFTCPRGTAYSKSRKVCDFTNNVEC